MDVYITVAVGFRVVPSSELRRNENLSWIICPSSFQIQLCDDDVLAYYRFLQFTLQQNSRLTMLLKLNEYNSKSIEGNF